MFILLLHCHGDGAVGIFSDMEVEMMISQLSLLLMFKFKGKKFIINVRTYNVSLYKTSLKRESR